VAENVKDLHSENKQTSGLQQVRKWPGNKILRVREKSGKIVILKKS